MPVYAVLTEALAAVAEGSLNTEEFTVQYAKELRELQPSRKKDRVFSLAASKLAQPTASRDDWLELAGLMASFKRDNLSHLGDEELHALHELLRRQAPYQRAFASSLLAKSRKQTRSPASNRHAS